MSAASSAQAADQGSVSPRLRRGEKEEEDLGQEGGQHAPLDGSNVGYNVDGEPAAPLVLEGAGTRFSVVIVLFCVQKSRRSACEAEEDVSIRNNNSGTFVVVVVVK